MATDGVNGQHNHPEYAGTRYEVQLGRLGAELLDAFGEIRAYPVATVPNYGGGTAPPAPTPQPIAPPVPQPPAPTPPPAPANPVVTIAPASGPAGTKFIANGRNFPAGATITWVISNAAAQTTSGTFQMVPGTTTFDFTINTEGTPPGAYTISFTNGRVGGSTAFTIIGQALPAGWQRWRGLPLPGYFEYRSEGPSISAPGCTVVVFYHHLPDANIEAVRQQVHTAWRQIGIAVSTPYRSIPNYDEYYGLNRSGQLAWNSSHATAIVDNSTLYIWDCSR